MKDSSLAAVAAIMMTLVSLSGGQLLSEGASDWYMRFHSSPFKRNVDAPTLKSFQVHSVIRHRYVITQVRAVCYNPAQVGQTYKFGYVMAKSALVSNVTLVSNGATYVQSSVDASDWARLFMRSHDLQQNGQLGNHSDAAPTVVHDEAHNDTEGNANGNANGNHNEAPHDHQGANGGNSNGGSDHHGHHVGGPNGHHDNNDDDQEEQFDFEDKNYLHHRADFKQFVLPINLKAQEDIVVTLTYEYLLERTDGLYSHTLSINPGELVPDFRVSVTVAENRPLRGLQVPAPVIGDLKRKGYVTKQSEQVYQLDFNLTTTEQYNLFGMHGFTGDIKVNYDLEEEVPVVTDLVVQDDFFVHFFSVSRTESLPSIPKHIIFLLDVSESMTGPKLEHAKDSIGILLDTLLQRQDDDDVNEDNQQPRRPHLVNVFTFDNDTIELRPFVGDANDVSSNSNETVSAFTCDNETRTAIVDALEEVNATVGTVANITRAVEAAIQLENEVLTTGSVPENALALVVLLTDGRSAAGNDSETIARSIRQMNKANRIPIFALGVGFDANMEFMENVAEASCGKTCTGRVIEDMEAEVQLRSVQKHLNDVVLKDLELDFVGEAFVEGSLTRNRFKVFHKGGYVAVAGQFNADQTYPQFKVQITGQSSLGLVEFPSQITPFVTNGCRSSFLLCSRPSFKGHCAPIFSTVENLAESKAGLPKTTVSASISGSCAFIAYEHANFGGRNLTLTPGVFEYLPAYMHRIASVKCVSIPDSGVGSLMGAAAAATADKDPEGIVSSLESFLGSSGKSLSPDNSVARLWAFVTIKDVLERAANDEETTKEEIEHAYSLAMKYDFLTPFTDIYFTTTFPKPPVAVGVLPEVVEPLVDPDSLIIQKNLLTYGDLSPIFYDSDPELLAVAAGGGGGDLNHCEPPISCQGNFHFEVYVEQSGFEPENEAIKKHVDCNGTITLFTKPDFEGEALVVDNQSIHQLYHKVNSQRMRSIRSRGNCCWLLFDHRFFSAGSDLERFCGDKEQALRTTNIGSIQRMNQQLINDI